MRKFPCVASQGHRQALRSHRRPQTAPLRSTGRKSPPAPPDSQLEPSIIGLCASSSANWRSWCWSRSEEHTSELQSLMRTSYAVFCLKKTKQTNNLLVTYHLIQ